MTDEQQKDLRRRMSASINSLDYDITNPEEMLTIMRFIYENSEVLTETYLKSGDKAIGEEYVKWSNKKSPKKSPKK